MNNSAGCSRSERRTLQDSLLLYLAAFERLLRTQGYASPTIRLKVRLVRDFGVWLRKRAIRLKDLSADHAECYLRHRARRLRPRTDDIVGLSQLLDLLRKEGIVAQRQASRARRWTAYWTSTRFTFAKSARSHQAQSAPIRE